MFEVEAADMDKGLNGEVKYYLASGDVAEEFDIDHLTGHLTVASPLDREKVGFFWSSLYS